MSSQEWSRTVRVGFEEGITAVLRAKTEAALAAAFAKFIEEIEEHKPEVTVGHPTGRSAETRSPAGTNGTPSGNGRRHRGPNKPRMQVPVQSLAGEIETDE